MKFLSALVCLCTGAVLYAPFIPASAAAPVEVSTCELIDQGSAFDSRLVAVKAQIHTDLIHFVRLASAACPEKLIEMYFTEDAINRPCSDTDFGRSVECPLNGVGYIIVATFIGIYHESKRTLEVKEMRGMTRSPRR